MHGTAGAVICWALPRTCHHQLPFLLWEMVLEAPHSNTSQPGVSTSTTGQKIPCPCPLGCVHGYSLGGPVPPLCPPLFPVPAIPAALHLPLPCSALVPLTTTTSLRVQHLPPTQGVAVLHGPD